MKMYTPSLIKSLELTKKMKFKNQSLMNFELGSHIVWKVEEKEEIESSKKFVTSLLKEATCKMKALAHSRQTSI